MKALNNVFKYPYVIIKPANCMAITVLSKLLASSHSVLTGFVLSYLLFTLRVDAAFIVDTGTTTS